MRHLYISAVLIRETPDYFSVCSHYENIIEIDPVYYNRYQARLLSGGNYAV